MNVQDCEQLTLFPADSHVSPSVWLESKEAKGMSATFGLKCSELSPNLRRVGSSVRTYLESCELPPGMWSRIWSVKAITSRCLIMKLRLSERRTEGNGSRLWQTPNVPNGGRVNPPDMSPTGIMPDGRKRQVGLEHQVKMVQANLWPTPDTQNSRDGSKTRKALKGRHGLSLHHAVSIWPTPTARDYKDGTAQSCQNVPENGLLGRAVHSRKILGGGYGAASGDRRIICKGWWSVEPDVGRVAYGVPARVDRLKCLGNAVVPQQFYPIFKAIYDIETGR